MARPAGLVALRNPFTPSWGEPYTEVAVRMITAIDKARAKAAGHEAVVVSHQLPIWTLRRYLEGKRLWHDPRRRQCKVGSLTSFVFDGDTLVDIGYRPAREALSRCGGWSSSAWRSPSR